MYRWIAAAAVAGLVIAGCTTGPADGDDPEASPATPGDPGLVEPPRIRFKTVVEGLEQPVHAMDPGDGSGRLFIVEQAGIVRIWDGQRLLDTPFVDVRDRVSSSGSEQGLLSIAFHPEYPDRPDVFLGFTRATDGDTVVARYQVHADDANRLDVASEEALVIVDQPASNHNGGLVAFGPDGYLYVGVGDGGLAQDAFQNGQNPFTLQGTILRLDVSPEQGYAIPDDNPYRGGPEREEIWAWGLRNPWRFSFDRETGDLYIADVGQDNVEEVNYQPADHDGGANYGWPVYEGSRPNRPGVTLSDAVFPVAEYSISGTGHCSVTGGFVYRGSAVPGLGGHFLFGDYCSGAVWAITQADGEWRMSELHDTDRRITSFAEDTAGEVYLLDHRGSVLRVAAA